MTYFLPQRCRDWKFEMMQINPQALVAQKFADEVVFRRFKGEGVEFFFNRTSLTPLPSDF